MREVDIQNDRHAGRRVVAKNRMIDEPVSVRNAGARGALRFGGRLRQVEIFVGERAEDVVGEVGRSRVGGPFPGSVAAFGDSEAGRWLMRVLLVYDFFMVCLCKFYELPRLRVL